MVDLVVLKYVDALFDKQGSLDTVLSSLAKLSLAFDDAKFAEIISSYELSKEKKVELLTSLIDDKKVTNLVKLLAQKNRLSLIPQISQELSKQVNMSKNIYNGVVYSKESLDETEIKELEEKFSNKFQIALTLSNRSGDYDGIKVEIEDLGVEVGFSLGLIQSQLKDFVLKAV